MSDHVELRINGLVVYESGGGPPPQPGETCEQFVTRMYHQYLHVEPDPGGFAYWVGQCAAGVPRADIEAQFRAIAPPPPVQPSTCTGASDLSDRAMHTYQFYEGQYQDVCFRSSGGAANLTGVAVANTIGKTAHYSVDGGPEQSFTPSGSDFRFIPIDGNVAAGVHTVRVKITGILGEGKFGLQAQGAGVGP